MSSDDFKVPSLSNSEVRSIAKKLRTFFRVDKDERVDILQCVEADTILTVKGLRPFRYEIVSDNKMNGDHGRTFYDGTTIVLMASRSTHHGAYLGVGQARNTIAHELGHATMHFEKLTRGAVMPRRLLGNVTPGWIKSYESAEHHAKVFAPAFLTNDEIASSLNSATEISVRFGISQQSAEIYHSQLLEEKEAPKKRAELAKQMRSFADQFGKTTSSQNHEMQFMSDPCSVAENKQYFLSDINTCVSPATPFTIVLLTVIWLDNRNVA